MVLAEGDGHLAVLFGEQTCQLEDALARHDHLVAIGVWDVRAERAHRQAMSVGGHGAQHAGVDLQQHAVQVVAHILLGHGETGPLDQPAQLALRDAEAERARTFLDTGEVVGGQGGEGEAAAPRLDEQLLVIDAHVDQRIAGQALADVHQLARRHGDFTRLGRLLQADTADQLDLQIGTAERQLLTLDHQQDVGQHGQRLTAFNDAGHQLQGFQQGFALNGEMHGGFLASRWYQVVSVRSRFL